MSALDRLGQFIAREQDALRSRAPDRTLVRERLNSLPLRAGSSRLRRLGLGLACAAIAAASLVLWARPLAREPLTLAVGRAEKPAPVGTFIEAPKLESLRLRFSDGTRVEMAPRSRARLVSLETTGAHLLIESGQVRVAVVRRPHASWRLSVGPFLVRVTGTHFEVRWNPEQDRFELDLEEGHVEVSGCVFGQGYRMGAGQKLSASCERRRFDVTDRRLAEESDPASGAASRVQSAGAEQGLAAHRSVAAAEAPTLEKQPARRRTAGQGVVAAPRSAPWRTPAARGKYAAAFAAAKASGFETTCARAGADELALLADAARYAREPQDEGYALRLLRRRFSGTRRAALAAFALGRLEFDAHRAYDEAAEWFATYLKEQPGGPLTREARGRLMEATIANGNRDRARDIAVHYLRDYPSGPHAEIARSLLQATGL